MIIGGWEQLESEKEQGNNTHLGLFLARLKSESEMVTELMLGMTRVMTKKGPSLTHSHNWHAILDRYTVRQSLFLYPRLKSLHLVTRET